jgi:hypothetical protein
MLNKQFLEGVILPFLLGVAVLSLLVVIFKAFSATVVFVLSISLALAVAEKLGLVSLVRVKKDDE